MKQYQFLVQDCKLVWNYLKDPFQFRKERSSGKLKLIQKALKPTMWTLFYDEYDRAMVDNYTGWKQCHFHY